MKFSEIVRLGVQGAVLRAYAAANYRVPAAILPHSRRKLPQTCCAQHHTRFAQYA